MISKILMRLAKSEKESEKSYVFNKVETDGVEAFKNAGTRLKSDAKFVLDLVSMCPECLEECDNVLFDRYDDNGVEVEQPVDEMLFAAMCCEKNAQAFKYLKQDISKKYLSAVQNGEVIKGSFQGQDCEIQLEADEDYIDLLKFVRFGYIKSNSLYIGCMLD